ncbi:hypothetical protein LMG22037_05861 [Paraburkholderia phenoliruptrix]|uniref:Uncharacterized protein n=1 Tax=Paraburkholderia phenoliruptrix TaxID=252970 RepID=A0A6J5CG82_9BURK|nr:hypothetical protein LMG22037_05861 [Paraburkholderia phenoliruptrix]
MAFEELDARVIGSTISIRLDGPSPGVSQRTPPAPPSVPRPAAAPVQTDQSRTVASDAARTPGAVSPRPAPDGVARSTPSSAEPLVVPKRKGRALFVMKPLNAERMRTAWAVIAVVFVAMVIGDICLRGGAKFFENFLPTVHVPSKTSANAVATTAPAQRVAPASEATAPNKADAPTASAPAAQANAPIAQQPQSQAQPAAAAAQVAQPATVAPVTVKAEPVKTVTVNPVPATVMASAAPVLPIPPAAPLPVHRRGRPVPEAPRRVEHEASQQPSEQASPILVGGQYSNKATDSKGSDSK